MIQQTENEFLKVVTKNRLIGRARTLRQDATDVERQLWARLRNNRLEGYKFKRQYVIEGYIADFVCLTANLIVELDGVQHQEQVHYDHKRTETLNKKGFRVLRFWNSDWVENQAGVLETIVATLRMPAARPHRAVSLHKASADIAPLP